MKNYETSRIENKEKLNDDFEQEVIAFLNYREGGTINIGIDKEGKIVGINEVDKINQNYNFKRIKSS